MLAGEATRIVLVLSERQQSKTLHAPIPEVGQLQDAIQGIGVFGGFMP